MTPRILPAALAAALALGGCAVGPDYQRPATPLPEHFAEAAASAAATAVDPRWWTLFGDTQLDALVELALRRNADLRTAMARVEQAEAAAREADAVLFPEIDGNAGASRSQASTRTATYSSAMSRLRDSRNASLSTSYEIDLWGRVRRGNETVQAQLLGSRYAQDAVRLSVAGQVTGAYLDLLGLDARLELAADTLKSRADSLALVKRRVAAGLAPPLDIHQAEGTLATAEAQQVELRRQRALAVHRLALLTGDPALRIDAGLLQRLPLPPQPPAGLPADLIERRPDVMQAEQALVAANAGIGTARAGYYPRFTLTGSAGSESRALADLFAAGAGTWSLGLAAFLPVLDFGRTAARVEQAEAQTRQARVAWENTLQTAYREVRDALVDLRENGAAEVPQAARVEHAGKALELARTRYAAGHAAYLDVLEAQRSLNDARSAQIVTRQARLNAAVALFKALGGGWRPDVAASAGAPPETSAARATKD